MTGGENISIVCGAQIPSDFPELSLTSPPLSLTRYQSEPIDWLLLRTQRYSRPEDSSRRRIRSVCPILLASQILSNWELPLSLEYANIDMENPWLSREEKDWYMVEFAISMLLHVKLPKGVTFHFTLHILCMYVSLLPHNTWNAETGILTYPDWGVSSTPWYLMV